MSFSKIKNFLAELIFMSFHSIRLEIIGNYFYYSFNFVLCFNGD